MNTRISLLLLLAACTWQSCTKDLGPSADSLDTQLEQALSTASDGAGPDFYLLPESDDFDRIPQDPRNPLTAAKVALGRLLYHETGLGLAPIKPIGKGTYSCASCHFAAAGFQANRHQGISEGGMGFGQRGEGRAPRPDYLPEELDVQPIRTPTTLHTAWQELMLWDGKLGGVGENLGTEDKWVDGTPPATNYLGYQGLETQAIASMGVHRLMINETIVDTLGYKTLFDQAFPDVPAPQRYDREHAGLAIAAYERTLIANRAPFQQWLRGNRRAMTDQEKRGAILFFGKAKCYTCHNGPTLANMEFHAIGMKDLYENPNPVFQAGPGAAANLGRGGFTERTEDMYKFKVPQLYNLADSPFYGHGASFTSLRDVVAYKNEAVPENPNVPVSQLAEGFQPLNLTPQEIDDITAFLESALRDPDLMRYQPAAILSGQCFPNNDPQSRQDLGCN